MTETQSEQLKEAERVAELATQQGRIEEARGLWQRVLQRSPRHPRATGFMAQLALRDGDAARARQLLEQAVVDAPNDPVLWLTLAHASRKLGDNARRTHALERAVVADPYCYPAMLERAAMLEQEGRKRTAAHLFAKALKLSPPDEALPRELLEFVVQGRAAVAENSKALETYLRSGLQVGAGSAQKDLPARFEECLEIATGSRKVFNQEPSLLYVPWLPAIPFYERSQFPWLEQLERATDEIRNEYLTAARDAAGAFEPYLSRAEGVPLEQFAELNNSPRWNALHLWNSGKRYDENCARCPKTVATVEAVPLIRIENFAPSVFFSVLAPHTRLPAHSSVTNARLVVHLPLIVPEHCGFRVGNTVREWKVGEAWVFDDTLNHEAWNDSDEYRVILIVDIWNPLLTAEERKLIPRLLNGMRDYYKE